MSCPADVGSKKKPPRSNRRGGGCDALVLILLCAQPGRPAEAGMMVPVVVREAEHLRISLFPRCGRSQAPRGSGLAVGAPLGIRRPPSRAPRVHQDRIGV